MISIIRANSSDTMLNVKTVLHPTDFSRRSDRAFELACAVARDRQARLIVLHVGAQEALVFGDQSTAPTEADPQAELQHRFRDFQERAGNIPVTCFLRDGEPADVIIKLAQEQNADMIVMGAHGRSSGLTRLLMGSVASEVAEEASCLVVTVRDVLPK
jgi:nucleotide-binding universal stress UspA family protein